MAKFAYAVLNLTPTAGNDNWTADMGAASLTGRIIDFNWGGESTSTVAMRTRLARPTTNGVTKGTALVATKLHPTSAAAAIANGCVIAWTTQPVLAANTALFATGWNSHGGVVRWLAGPDEGFQMVGSATAGYGQISCRADSGVGLSDYGVIIEED